MQGLKIVKTLALAVRRSNHSAKSRSLILNVKNALYFSFLNLQGGNGCPAHPGTIIYEAARVLAAQYKLDKAGPAIPVVSFYKSQFFHVQNMLKCLLRNILIRSVIINFKFLNSVLKGHDHKKSMKPISSHKNV